MNRLHEWFWTHGINRQGKYSIGIRWLDRITTLSERNAAIKHERARNLGKPKGCLAIWGPSQAGKSTLLSSYIDGSDSGDGSDSAISWPGGIKARFTPKSAETTQRHPQTVIFNPYNLGSDASGIATRYISREEDEVQNPKAPCILKLATDAQIMHAIAAGYLFECDPKNAKGLSVFWDAPQIDTLVKDLPVVDGKALPSEEAFFILRNAFYTVEAMIKAREKRFTNLTVSPPWSSLRESLLENRRLICSPDNSRDFTRKLLWDNCPALNSLHDAIVQKIKDLRNKWGDREIYCSLEAAAVLLDINSFRTYSDPGKSAASPQTKRKVESFNWTISGDTIEVTVCASAPSLDISAEAFGLFQASVGELIVPLRKTVINKRSKFFSEFLSKNDLLDFPGVPQQGEAANEAQLEIGNLPATHSDLFTRLFKRGKTISMVASRSMELSIDSFLLLVRSDTTISKPHLINSGIEQWQRCFDLDNAVSSHQGKSFPVNVNMTFFASVINDVFKNGATNLGNIGDRFDDLGLIASARNASFHLTNYPHLATKYRLDPELQASVTIRQNIKSQILGNAEFSKRFPGITESLEAVLETPDGGAEVMFSRLLGINHERRFALYERIEVADITHLKDQCSDHLPDASQSNGDRQQLLVKRAKEALLNRLESLSVDSYEVTKQLLKISNGIKDLCHYGDEDFSALPDKKRETDYVVKHLEKWLSRRIECNFLETELSLRERADRIVFLGAIVNSCPINELAKFIADCLDKNPEARRNVSTLRYALAVAFSNSIIYAKISRDASYTRCGPIDITRMQAPENYQESPYYKLLVAPFLERLSVAENAASPSRPPQAGDSELTSIIFSIQNNL